MPKFMLKYARSVSLFIALLILFSSSIPIQAADSTTPPTITAISGPTSGIASFSYTFTTTVTSTSGNEIETVFLKQTTSAVDASGSSAIGSISAGSSGCTGTSCSLTYDFTPSSAGTYYIFVAVNHASGGGSTSCNTHLALVETNCFDSRGQYITFTVSAAPTTPIVQTITGLNSGVVGGTYQISAYIIAPTNYPILTGIIYSTPNLLEDDKDRTDVVRTQAADGTACTSSSCAISGTFTPTAVGIYDIHVAVSYTDVNAGYDLYCRTHPASTSALCSYSSGKYITFVVTTDGSEKGSGGDLPSTGLLTSQTINILIGLGFISLGILTTQTTNIYASICERRVAKRKSKLEENYK